jgi:hypothetical protein
MRINADLLKVEKITKGCFVKITLEIPVGTSTITLPDDAEKDSLGRIIDAERQVILKRDALDKLQVKMDQADTGRRWDVENPRPIQYTGSTQTRLPVAGLEWYHGFGHGTFYAPDGRILNVSGRDAERFAEYFGVKRTYEDSFRYYKATALGD